MNILNDLYRLKDGSVKTPKNYLGACIRKWNFEDGTSCWAMGTKQYIKMATDKIDRDLELEGLQLTKNPATPFSSGYRAELDISTEL